VTPATLLSWHRKLAASQYNTSNRQVPERLEPRGSVDASFHQPEILAQFCKPTDGRRRSQRRRRPGSRRAELRHLRAAGLLPDAALLPGIEFVAVARALGIEAYAPRSIAELEYVARPQPHGNSPLLQH
jgi:hypothetical protein